MDTDLVIFWLVVLYCLSGIITAVRRMNQAGTSWPLLQGAILIIAIAGKELGIASLIYAAAGMWVLLVLVPGLLGRRCNQLVVQQRYSSARRLARLMSWLHPTATLRAQSDLVRGLDLAHRGDTAGAEQILSRCRNDRTLTGLIATFYLFRIKGQWEEMAAWQTGHAEVLAKYPNFLPYLLRSRAECGDIRGMIQLYQYNQAQIGNLAPVTSRDTCRLMLFAFGGRADLVGRQFEGPLGRMPANARKFWLATAEMEAGARASAKTRFDSLMAGADPPLRLAIQRRLARIDFPPALLDEAAKEVIEAAVREQAHDRIFGSPRSLFAKEARATQMIIVLNLVMFGVETALGGSTNPEVLQRLGAVYPPAVRAGEWWRLLAATFLHFGPLHIAMNMLALWVLGPFVEFALGFWRYLVVYLAAGIGSMGVVTLLSPQDSAEWLVGASGAIMGIVGATGALMLRGWRGTGAGMAKRRLISVVVIIAVQTIFDNLVPQISGTAHLSGAAIGFAVCLVLRDRFRAGETRR